MTVILSDEQLEYVKASGRTILNACPGSGKTTTVAYKLKSLVKTWPEKWKRSAGVACLSFTNVAKNEIALKYKEIDGFALSAPHTISTIDSFVNSFITLPFAHKLKDIGRRYRIIDDMAYLDALILSNWKLMKEFGSTVHRFAPSKIDYTITNGYSWDGHDKSADPNFIKYGKAVKTAQIQMGLLKTTDSAFLALHILKKYGRIGNYLATRFPYVIIDEAQDTSEIQHSILEILCEHGLKHIDLVGDPYQCLYQWRNARPELFLQKFDDKDSWSGIYLTENRRSTKKIVEVFGKLRRNSEKEIVAINSSSTDPDIHVIKYSSADYQEAIKKYEALCHSMRYGQNTIIVRGNTLKNLLLGREGDYQPWNNSTAYSLINGRLYLENNGVKDAVKTVRRLVIELLIPGISFGELKEKEILLKGDKDMNGLIFNLIRDLPPFSLSIRDWTARTQMYLKEKLQLSTEPDFGMRKKNTANFDKTTLLNPVGNYFKRFTTPTNIPVNTVHQVKGSTFDSVFFVLSADSKGQNISLNDFTLKEEMPNEKQRLVYVALSRPRFLLCIGVPDSTSDEILKYRFGESLKII
jgi:DNA helicase II / ATP-dependent DNA helicase PcrA